MGRSRNKLRINCRQAIKIIRYVNPEGKINYCGEGPDESRYTFGYQHRLGVRRRAHSRQYLRPQGKASRRSLKVYRATSFESFGREVKHAPGKTRVRTLAGVATAMFLAQVCLAKTRTQAQQQSQTQRTRRSQRVQIPEIQTLSPNGLIKLTIQTHGRPAALAGDAASRTKSV